MAEGETCVFTAVVVVVCGFDDVVEVVFVVELKMGFAVWETDGPDFPGTNFGCAVPGNVDCCGEAQRVGAVDKRFEDWDFWAVRDEVGEFVGAVGCEAVGDEVGCHEEFAVGGVFADIAVFGPGDEDVGVCEWREEIGGGFGCGVRGGCYVFMDWWQELHIAAEAGETAVWPGDALD